MPLPTPAAIQDALRLVIDPEVGINIVDLGLVYAVDVADDRVAIAMTMTSPACPLAEYLRAEIADAIRRHVPDAGHVTVEILWDPPWTPERISAAARRELGWPDDAPPSSRDNIP